MKGLPVLDHPTHNGALKPKVGIKTMDFLKLFFPVYVLTLKKQITDTMWKTDF